MTDEQIEAIQRNAGEAADAALGVAGIAFPPLMLDPSVARATGKLSSESAAVAGEAAGRVAASFAKGASEGGGAHPAGALLVIAGVGLAVAGIAWWFSPRILRTRYG